MSIRIGSRLKERILAGTLNFDSDALRRDGPSRLFSRLVEANVLDTALLNGGFVTVVAMIELAFAGFVMAHGAANLFHSFLLLAWIALMGTCFMKQHNRRVAATMSRLELTHRTVEAMVGYRTRIAQQTAGEWHDAEDIALEAYYANSVTVDDWAAGVDVLASRGWTFAALVAMLPSVVGGVSDPSSIAISIGGVLLAERAFVKWLPAAGQLSDVLLAWRHVGPMFTAAADLAPGGHPSAGLSIIKSDDVQRRPILEAHDLIYRYPDRAEPVIRHWSLSVHESDRVLLEGPSGGGKSTLCALLAGWRQPSSGLLLLHGIDRHTMGFLNWRRRVVAVPQFHDNHVIAETFAFNLLMGRRWPPTATDLDEARAICGELGLDELLSRMPSGMFQLIGETGWQLSHGEKSRLFIARGLLQSPDLLILDESLAALDPENVDRSVACVFKRAKTLIVVAHP